MLRGRTTELSCLENAPSELHFYPKNGRRFQGQLKRLVRGFFDVAQRKYPAACGSLLDKRYGVFGILS